MTERGDSKISQFAEHANFTYLDLRGDLVIIGPAPDLIDLVPVIPHLSAISFVNIVSDEFRRELQGNLNNFIRNYERSTRSKLPTTWKVTQSTPFQALRGKYDSAVFFGAPPSFARYRHYQQIPQILKPGGTFYGTVEAFELPDEYLDDHSCSLTHFPDIESHPFYHGPWSGIVISKANI